MHLFSPCYPRQGHGGRGSLSQLSQIENVMSSAILTKDKDPCVQKRTISPKDTISEEERHFLLVACTK